MRRLLDRDTRIARINYLIFLSTEIAESETLIRFNSTINMSNKGIAIYIGYFSGITLFCFVFVFLHMHSLWLTFDKNMRQKPYNVRF